MLNAKHLRKLKNLIGPVILIYFLLQIDPSVLKNVVSKINTIFFIALMLFFPMMILKTYRWLIILRNFEVKINFLKLFNLNLRGILYGSITPGRVGEIYKGYLLGKMEYPLSASIVSAVFDRIVDIFFLLCFALFGLIYFYNVLRIDPVSLLAVLGSLGAALSLLLHPKTRLRLLEFAKKKLNDKDGSTIKYLKELKENKLFLLSFLSIMAWLIYFYEIFLFSRSLSLQIDVIFLMAAISVSTIISILPISILGIGTRDATLIFLFSMQSISTEKTIALSFLILLMFVFNIFACYLFSLTFEINRNVRS